MAIKRQNIIMKTEPVIIDMTPYATARFSSDLVNLLNLGEGYVMYPAVKYFLLCLSIELGMKSTLTAKNCISAELISLGHDLGKIAERFNQLAQGIVDKKDIEILVKMTKFYKGDVADRKTIVYAGPYLKEQMLRGYKGLPDIEAIKNISIKIQEHLSQNRHYIEL